MKVFSSATRFNLKNCGGWRRQFSGKLKSDALQAAMPSP